MTHLESRCYNKSDYGHKALASPNLDEHKSFLVCFKSLLDLSKHCLHIVHSQPSVLLGSHPSSSYSSSFLVLPSLCKSWDEISFKGEGCNTPCYGFANHLH
jgi:hypothetical protein